MPLIGRLIRDMHAARMARTLSTMIASRLPLIDGLRLTASTVHNARCSDATLEDGRGDPRRRQPVGRDARSAGIFPPLLVYLAASGEAAGQLDAMLERAAEYLEREFDSFTATACRCSSPRSSSLMGGVVATIVLAILLPILQLQTLTGL